MMTTASTVVRPMLLNLLISATDQRSAILSLTIDGQLPFLVHLLLPIQPIHSKAFCVDYFFRAKRKKREKKINESVRYRDYKNIVILDKKKAEE